MILKSKDLLGLKDITKEEIQGILDTAKTMKLIIQSGTKKTPHLQGKTVITLFYENSTRTRTSFELAAKYMSGNSVNISVSTSSVAKGETLIDTGRTLDVMGTDVIIIRHSMAGAPDLLAKHTNAAVINAGDGLNEHPTQALLDMFTVMEAKGDLNGLKVAIVGDILHSRVARSNIWGMTKMGAKVVVAGPPTLLPSHIKDLGVEAYTDIEKAVEDADVVMALRIQKERLEKGLFPSVSEYARFFGINENIVKKAKKDALIMHPGPVNRGVEITSALVDGDSSLIDTQVTNGVAIRMALLYLMTRKDG
ncbi:MAG: aspartate carbamoyltransferase catalytic subunit [Clostridia bacterium]|jgi:aspartate carbamoyltransferase catalytic subunit|nr:aspartate carbamoyltransferase catalytic subunit [Clostridiaceae bacterium]